MSILVVGINYKTAPITVREKVYFAQDKLALYLQDLINRGVAHEAVLLSTCNRSELYCDAEDIDAVRTWFCSQTAAARNEIESALYVYRDEEAVRHIMQVACGLDSMVLGEPQILGQIKDAYSESCTAGAVGALFHRLFQQVFVVAKEIRTTTAIGACPVSVASAAARFAMKSWPAFDRASVALIGAGATSELLIRYLKPQLQQPLIVINRSLEKASALAAAYGGAAYGLNEMTTALAQADIVFSSTGSALPLVTQAVMADVQARRGGKAIMLVDIAVPRDVEPAVVEMPNVQLFCVDDLMTMIETNRQGREHAADKAREMISQKSAEFMASLTSQDKVTHAIRVYRGQIEELCRAELLKARQQLQQGVDPGRVLESFAQAYTNKLLHVPSVQMRQAGAEGRFELLRFAKQLFAIPDPEIEHS